MSRRTKYYRAWNVKGKLSPKWPAGIAPAFAPDAPWAPLDKKESSTMIDRARNDGSRWNDEMSSLHVRVGLQDQVSTYREIAKEGVSTFRYRCGGLHGSVHRVLIARDGAIVFPDHKDDDDSGVTDILATLSQEDRSAPTCSDIRHVLKAHGERDKAGPPLENGFIGLWGPQAVLSDLPPWAQAFVWVLAARRNFRYARLPPEGEKNDLDLAYRRMAELELAQEAPPIDEAGFDSLDLWRDDYAALKRDLPLSWPDGFEAYHITGLIARHGQHYDGVVKVAPAPGSAPFREPDALMAFTVCRGENGLTAADEEEEEEHTITKALKESRLAPAILTREGAGWRVAE